MKTINESIDEYDAKIDNFYTNESNEDEYVNYNLLKQSFNIIRTQAENIIAKHQKLTYEKEKAKQEFCL